MNKLLIKNIKQLLQVRENGITPVKGKAMAHLPLINNAYLLIENGLIADYGEMKNCPNGHFETIDATNKTVMPTWVDSHTHIVFAKYREEEFVMKIQGKSYEDIAKAGGGILNSARKLRETDEDDLYYAAAQRLTRLIQQGTGAIEIKSGYGLSFESELKMLRVIKRLKANFSLPIKANLLASHAIPTEYKKKRNDYINLVVNEIIPAVAKEKLADFIDTFCEEGFFTPTETDLILKTGIKHGLKPKIHANQLAVSGGVQVGVKNNAISVDHLEQITENEIQCLQNSTTMPVALPGCSFYLGIPFTPARKFINAGLPVAIASDYNPGSAPSGNMGFCVSLACIKMKLTPEEAINSATINAAFAMDTQHEVGSITKGKRANIIITKAIPSYNYIPYSFGENVVEQVLINGKQI